MTDREVLVVWERYAQRVKGLTAAAISREHMPVAELLGGLDVEVCSDPRGIGFPPLRHDAERAMVRKRIMEAIAREAIPRGWEYEVVAVMGGSPQIFLLSYAAQ